MINYDLYYDLLCGRKLQMMTKFFMGSKPRKRFSRRTDICLKCLMRVTGAVSSREVYRNQQGNITGTNTHMLRIMDCYVMWPAHLESDVCCRIRIVDYILHHTCIDTSGKFHYIIDLALLHNHVHASK